MVVKRAFAVHLPYAPIPDANLPFGITIFRAAWLLLSCEKEVEKEVGEEMEGSGAEMGLASQKNVKKMRINHAH